MALLYLDTSALVKLYIQERGSERAMELASDDADHELAICSITQVEFHSTISRRRRSGDLDEVTLRQAAESFDDHLENTFTRCPVDDQTLNLASELVARHPLRGYDGVQLAACLVLARTEREPPTFVSADRRLLSAARAEGLSVLDPEA